MRTVTAKCNAGCPVFFIRIIFLPIFHHPTRIASSEETSERVDVLRVIVHANLFDSVRIVIGNEQIVAILFILRIRSVLRILIIPHRYELILCKRSVVNICPNCRNDLLEFFPCKMIVFVSFV